MIKEDKVLMPVNNRNIKSFTKKGYDLPKGTNEVEVLIEDLSKSSKVKITAICDICQSENVITYVKYLTNFNRNNKCYYSCFKCKNIEKEKTCVKKYGVKSYSMTDEFKTTESVKWKGIRKGDEKYRKTMMERYGVDCYFKTEEVKERNRIWMSSDEFVEKSKKSLIKKYGVDSFSKTDEFKKILHDKKDIIVEKMKKTFKDRYDVEYYSQSVEWKNNMTSNKLEIIKKIKETCLLRYGFDNVSKVASVKQKSRNTKISRGYVVPDELLTEWELYKKDVRNLTRRNKKELYENWNGYDYYDDELIIGYSGYSHTHKFYPTIDHKTAVYYGFVNNISPEDISDISNLCITKRSINSRKRDLTEEDFNL
jgi:hypothetical protein